MRRLLCGLALAAALAAPAALADRTQPAGGKVLALGLSGADVVFASAATGERCPALTIWHTDLRFDRRFSTGRDCPATSTGSGIAAVAEAQGRVLWLSYAGGNDRDWTLYTASERARTPRLLRFVTVDVSAPPPIVVGDADERLLPYA